MLYHKCLLLIVLLQNLDDIRGEGELIDPLKLNGPNYLGLTLAQVVETSGFLAQTYDVVGYSGYITTVTRIINPKADLSSIRRTAVFHHGITQTIISPQFSLCHYARPQTPPQNINNNNNNNYNNEFRLFDSFNVYQSFINISQAVTNLGLTNTQTCLPFHLSNNNYDVWLFEARASTPASSKHINQYITAEEYYNFDLHDQAINDVPAQIAKVKEISGRDKVAYFGFSQSTSFMFILLSEQPQFQDNLTAFVAQSPVAFGSETKGLFRELWDILNPLPGIITNNLNIPFPVLYEDSQALDNLFVTVCGTEIVATTVCRDFINTIAGPDNSINVLNIPLFSRALSQTSYKAFIQLGQWSKQSTFNKFDFKDPQLNWMHYGQTTAPQYDISKIKFDKIIFVRSPQNDILSPWSNTQEFISHMTVPLFRDIVTPPSYNHFSYFLSFTNYWDVIVPVTQALDQIYESQ